MRRALRRTVVRTLNALCAAVDWVVYRPFVVKLGEPLPRWWNCELAPLSMALDDRWGTGYWSSDRAPAAPDGPCDACHRRAAWLTVGGEGAMADADPERYLDRHAVQLCGWCRPDLDPEPRDRAELDAALAGARASSVAWRWR